MKVLAKKNAGGGNGCWLPAEVTKEDYDGKDVVYTVRFFLGHGSNVATLPRHWIDPLYDDMPLKYDATGKSFYPTPQGASQLSTVSSNHVGAATAATSSTDVDSFSPLPGLASDLRNAYGIAGRSWKITGQDRGGDYLFATNLMWQNITLMNQTVGKCTLFRTSDRG